MNKDAVIYTRVPAKLKKEIEGAAKQRSMNTSEFVRYVVQLFFDPDVDGGPQNMYKVLVDPPVDYRTES